MIAIVNLTIPRTVFFRARNNRQSLSTGVKAYEIYIRSSRKKHANFCLLQTYNIFEGWDKEKLSSYFTALRAQYPERDIRVKEISFFAVLETKAETLKLSEWTLI